MTEQDAIELAKRFALEQGWPWRDPAIARLRRGWFGNGDRWEIFSNAEGLGAKVRLLIDGRSGEIIEKGYIPR